MEEDAVYNIYGSTPPRAPPAPLVSMPHQPSVTPSARGQPWGNGAGAQQSRGEAPRPLCARPRVCPRPLRRGRAVTRLPSRPVLSLPPSLPLSLARAVGLCVCVCVCCPGTVGTNTVGRKEDNNNQDILIQDNFISKVPAHPGVLSACCRFPPRRPARTRQRPTARPAAACARRVACPPLAPLNGCSGAAWHASARLARRGVNAKCAPAPCRG